MRARPNSRAVSPAGGTADATAAVSAGRNMFGPVRDDWDLSWTGWSGEDPPYRTPEFAPTDSAPA